MKYIKHYKNIIIYLIFFTPALAFALLEGLKQAIWDVGDVLSALKPLVFGLAFLYFFWGMSQFILHAGDEKKRAEGKQKMIWGVIALFVMLSIMGIISTFGSLIGIGGNQPVLQSQQLPLYNTGLPGQSGQDFGSINDECIPGHDASDPYCNQ
jgi:hypothetical protein